MQPYELISNHIVIGCLIRVLAQVQRPDTVHWQTGKAPVGPEPSQSSMRRYHLGW